MFAVLQHVPAWLRPAAYGAGILAAIVSFRLVLALPSILASPMSAIEPLLAILAAAAAGASGGFAYTLVRPALRKLGRIGNYLTGIVCVGAYLSALMLVAPVAFGEQFIEGPEGWVAVGITTLLFGLVVGHAWFSPATRSDESEARAR